MDGHSHCTHGWGGSGDWAEGGQQTGQCLTGFPRAEGKAPLPTADKSGAHRPQAAKSKAGGAGAPSQ